MKELPVLYIVIPCYNEQEVLPITAPQFLRKIQDLTAAGKISPESRVLFVNNGSKDRTWSIIQELAASDEHYAGICQSRNRGHQNAVLAGLMEAKDHCDITISIDCDGQDDINAMDGMVDAYRDGCDVVYGVRSKRETDTFFKRFTAESFYKLLSRNLIYTAITRAKKRVILVGQKKALYMAIHRDGSDRRNSMLANRLSALFSYKKDSTLMPARPKKAGTTNTKEVS